MPTFERPFGSWEKKAQRFVTQLSDKRLIQAWSQANEPQISKVRMPRASSAQALVDRVAKNVTHGTSWLELLGVSGAAARNFKVEDATQDLVDDWMDIVVENNKELAEEQVLAKDWPQRVQILLIS